MAEPVLYMRGFPQSISSEPFPEELLNDFSAIIELSDVTLDGLSTLLSEAEGFLSPKDLLLAIQKVVEDPNTAKALRAIIGNIDPIQIKPMTTFLEEKSKGEGFRFDPKRVERLKQILKKLIQPYSSMVRFQKAERLANITGQRLEAVELICDLRPIFDENRKNVEGMMPDK